MRAYPAVPQISVDGRRLISTPAYSYQWLYNGNELHNGAGREYEASLSGSYSVRVIDSNGCSRTSEVYELVLTSVLQKDERGVLLYPNPAGDELVVELAQAPAGAVIEVRNILGIVVRQMESYEERNVLSLDRLPAGTYYLTIHRGAETMVKKFIKR